MLIDKRKYAPKTFYIKFIFLECPPETLKLATQPQLSTAKLWLMASSKMSALSKLKLIKNSDFEKFRVSVRYEIKKIFLKIIFSQFKGKYVVLFFYPLDFTFVCPTEIIAFSEAAAQFKKINCEVIAASTGL